jgi:hypothetical protein
MKGRIGQAPRKKNNPTEAPTQNTAPIPKPIQRPDEDKEQLFLETKEKSATLLASLLPIMTGLAPNKIGIDLVRLQNRAAWNFSMGHGLG